MLKLKLQNFGHLMQRADSMEKILMLGNAEGPRRKGWRDEMVGWHHQLNDFEQAPGDGEGQGSLASMGSQRVLLVQEMLIWSLGQVDPLLEEMATHSSILFWKNPMDRGAWLPTVIAKSPTQLSAHTHTHNRIQFSHIKELNPAMCDNIGRPWRQYGIWNNLDEERQMLYDFTPVKSNETNEQTIKKKQNFRYREQ